MCGEPRRPIAPDLALLEGIPGLAFRHFGAPRQNPPREPIADLDTLPFLDFHLIDIDWYFRHHASIGMSSWLFLTTSRGCQAKCTFCATPVLWPGGLRRQSVPRLLAEIAHQRSLFPQSQFAFMDDTFFTDKRWLSAFFDGIAQLGVKYCCIGRADHLTPDDVRRLAETDCVYVALGIETGNQARQKAIRKHLDLDRVRASISLLARHKVFCKGFFMLGFPDETPAEIVETINFAVELKRLGMDECNFFPVSIYPGTELAAGASAHLCASEIYRGPQAEKLIPGNAGNPGPSHSPNATLDRSPSLQRQGSSSTISRSDPPETPTPTVSSSVTPGNPPTVDIGETKLLRYANIPKGDVNAFFTAAQLLEIVKLAYRRVDTAEPITLADLPHPARA